MKPLDACRIGDFQQIMHQPVEAPAMIAWWLRRLAESTHVEAQQPVAGSEYRQPFGPDVRVGRNAVMESNRLRLVDPRRNHVAQIIIKRTGPGLDHRHDGRAFSRRPTASCRAFPAAAPPRE